MNYICDPKKTQNGLNIVSVNCMPDARNAYQDMKRIYEYYSNRKFNEPKPKSGQAHVKMIHYIQSFDPKDNISIDTAQLIGLDTVREMFGENVQAVIATHDDTDVLHNHIMINAYALDGKHFLSNKTTLKKIKRISDEVCLRYGIVPYRKTGHGQETKISGYHEWQHIRNKTSWKQLIRDKIDELVPIADSFDDLVRMMNNQGFTFKQGKNICVKAPGQQRYVGLKTLGENYSFEHINKRIAAHREKALAVFAEPYQIIITSIRTKAGAYRNTSPVNDTCDRFMRLYRVITQEKIASLAEAEIKLTNAERIYADTLQKVQALKEKIYSLESEIKSANHYFDMNFMQRTFPKKADDKAAVAVIKEHGFKNKDDISVLTEQLEKYQSELAKLNDQLSSEGGEVQKFKEIVEEYYHIKDEPSYVEKLVQEDKEKITSDDWNNMISEQRKIILDEIDTVSRAGMYYIEKQIWDKIVKLRTMNVEPHEAEQLIRTLAVIRADGIQKIEDARRLAAKMKYSEQSVKKKRSELHREIEKLNEAINRADVYVRYKDDPSFRDPGFLEMCRKIAEENGATDNNGFERLVARCDELKARDDSLSQKEYFYRKRKADYESVIEAVQFINIYPQERSAEEKKTPPKKKLRR